MIRRNEKKNLSNSKNNNNNNNKNLKNTKFKASRNSVTRIYFVLLLPFVFLEKTTDIHNFTTSYQYIVLSHQK